MDARTYEKKIFEAIGKLELMADFGGCFFNFQRLEQIIRLIDYYEDDEIDPCVLHLNTSEFSFWCFDILNQIKAKLEKQDRIIQHMKSDLMRMREVI